MENVKEYVEKFTTFGEPVDFKGLKIKPIIVKDADRFFDVVNAIQIEKNKIPSIDVIRMSYLEFLFSMMALDKECLNQFTSLLSLTLGMESNKKNLIDGFPENEILSQSFPNGSTVYYINGWDVTASIHKGKSSITIQGVKLTASDFDTFRKIILFQNIDEYDDAEMSDDFRRIIEQYYALKFKNIHQPTLEDKMMAVIASTSYTVETIKTLPLRTFEKLFACCISKVDYIATKPLEIHLEKGKSIDHWVYHPIRDKYAGIFGDAQELANKVTSL